MRAAVSTVRDTLRVDSAVASREATAVSAGVAVGVGTVWNREVNQLFAR